MDAVKYIKEKERMCMTEHCIDCPISAKNNGTVLNCSKFAEDHPETAVELVQKWSEENQLEIDWFKVPAGTPVIVRKCDCSVGYNADFCCYIPQRTSKYGIYVSRENGCKRVSPDKATDVEFWAECELDTSVDPRPYYK